MLYRCAKLLASGDEVRLKRNAEVYTVVEVQHEDKDILIMLTDGVWYHHTEVR